MREKLQAIAEFLNDCCEAAAVYAFAILLISIAVWVISKI